MKKTVLFVITAFIVSFFTASNAFTHCEIPCGVYDDQLRTKMIYEHTVTIEKSMRKILELSKENPVNYNQLVRWVSNKEAHATEIQHIVSQYFMVQRINPEDKKYLEKLSILHRMLRYASRCKQTTNLESVNRLRELLLKFEGLYFGKKQN